MTELLFVYGTLQQSDVQLDTFGHLVEGERDWLAGYVVHGGHIRATGNRLDRVPGLALVVTDEELEAADELEIGRHRRVHVMLATGRTAWVYVAS